MIILCDDELIDIVVRVVDEYLAGESSMHQSYMTRIDDPEAVKGAVKLAIMRGESEQTEVRTIH